MDKLPDHMTSFKGFPGISSRHPWTINVTTFEAQTGEENLTKMVSLEQFSN